MAVWVSHDRLAVEVYDSEHNQLPGYYKKNLTVQGVREYASSLAGAFLKDGIAVELQLEALAL